MKRISTNLFAFLIAFFAYQGAYAQNVIFEEDFSKDLGEFTIEGFNGVNNNIWQWDGYYNHAVADGYGKFFPEEGPIEVYLVSPEIKLGTSNQVSFGRLGQWFNSIESEVGFYIREAGSAEWVACPATFTSQGSVNDLPNTGNIDVPAEYENMAVQFGFKYTSKIPNSSGILHISNFVVKSASGEGPVDPTPTEKKDPEISFAVAEAEATVGGIFEAPVLNNPNNVEVAYSSDNADVAYVDPATGMVTIFAEGTTTITATSVENDNFLSATASYVLTVNAQGGGSAAEVLFEEAFNNDKLGGFTQENADGSSSFWQWFFITNSAYGTTEGPAIDSRLVSPEINLFTENVVKFSYRACDFTDLASQVKLSVREVGGAWTDIELPVITNNATWQDVEIAIPAEFNNKTVQIAIWFNANMGTLCVKNLSVTGVKASVKADPEISFAQDTYEFYFDHSSFDGVALNNPNNVEVVYSIENNDYSVADVDSSTGKVWIYNCGTVVITATSAETDEFKEGKASYTLIITEDVPTGIEGITADDLENGKIYDLQGRRVNKLAKGVFIVNGKKVVIK